MNALLRIAEEMREAQRPVADRAYEHLLAVAKGERDSIDLSDHDLVLGIRTALWQRELGIAQMALGELEVRTAADTVHVHEEKRAA